MNLLFTALRIFVAQSPHPWGPQKPKPTHPSPYVPGLKRISGYVQLRVSFEGEERETSSVTVALKTNGEREKSQTALEQCLFNCLFPYLPQPERKRFIVSFLKKGNNTEITVFPWHKNTHTATIAYFPKQREMRAQKNSNHLFSVWPFLDVRDRFSFFPR